METVYLTDGLVNVNYGHCCIVSRKIILLPWPLDPCLDRRAGSGIFGGLWQCHVAGEGSCGLCGRQARGPVGCPGIIPLSDPVKGFLAWGRPSGACNREGQEVLSQTPGQEARAGDAGGDRG